MFQPTLVVENRRHARAPLTLPVRLRWLGPFGQAVEVTQTLDVCRNGLLFYRPEPCPIHGRVWVTFPFDRETPAQQPETPARVVRVKTTPSGGHLVAVEFEPPRRPGGPPREHNRRASERFSLALPIRVRPTGTPWPEETMTIDVSDGGILFWTTRQYSAGDTVYLTLPYGPWASAGEIHARVVRTLTVPGSAEQQVALAFFQPTKS